MAEESYRRYFELEGRFLACKICNGAWFQIDSDDLCKQHIEKEIGLKFSQITSEKWVIFKLEIPTLYLGTQ